MNRREVVLGAAAAGCLAFVCSRSEEPEHSRLTSDYARSSLGLDIYFETHGKPDGPNVVLAVPLYATTKSIVGAVSRANKEGYIEHLGDRYRLLIADYPYGSGRSAKLKDPGRLTVEQVCADYLALADAAGMVSFAAVGYSWGGNSSLQLATRSPRVNAVVVGGWPALSGPYEEMRQVTSKIDGLPIVNVKNYLAYYESLRGWPEKAEVSKLECPRLNYLDKNDDSKILGVTVGLIRRFRENRETLRALGWETVEVDSGKGHRGGLRPSIAGPVIRAFLDKHYPEDSTG